MRIGTLYIEKRKLHVEVNIREGAGEYQLLKKMKCVRKIHLECFAGKVPNAF